MVPLGSIKPALPVALCRCSQQIAHPDQVVSGQCEAKPPADPRRSAVARLAQPATGLSQPKISSIRLRFCWLIR